jgi:hypothetical protein
MFVFFSAKILQMRHELFFFATTRQKKTCLQATTGILSIATMANLTVQQTRLRYIFALAIHYPHYILITKRFSISIICF